MNKRILITGGAGYIGSKLVGMLLNNGCHVTVIDNLMYKQTSLLNYISDARFIFEYGDVTNIDYLKDYLCSHSYDYVIPLAALVGVDACNKNPDLAYKINRDHVVALCELCKRQNIPILYPNTNSGYGLGKHTPDGVPVQCTEEDSLQPISIYGKSKQFAEDAVASNENNWVFRLATVFGSSPRMRLDLMVNDFVYKAVTDKYIVLFESGFYRNFVHIFDVCKAFALAIDGKIKPGIYNLGLPDVNLTKLQLAQKICEYVPNFAIFDDEINFDPDKRNYIVSNKKILDQDFWFSVSLENGILELLETYNMIVPLNTKFTNK